MSRHDALTYPLAGLLAQPAGSRTAYEISGVSIPLADDLHLADPIEGRLTVTRTNRGVVVDARIRTAIAASCSRCLRDIEVPLDLRITEEVLPSVDLATGLAVDTSAEPDAVRLTDHHELDLAPLVGEAISLAEPIAPRCEPACQGLCPECGERLGPDHVPHPEDPIDPRLAALQAFRVDDAAENE